MADEPRVRVGWALWGKEAGTRTDYAVLACSREPFSRPDFGKIINRFAAGTPETRSSGAWELPLITVSWVGVEPSLHIGISVTDSIGQVDALGRPITQTSYYCVPYREVSEARISYSALYDAVRKIQLAPEDGDLIPLTVPATGVGEAAQRVEDLGERVVGAAAAALLRGPVSIVDAEETTLEQRLGFIDAVASLLPYGYRAKLTAATWSDSGTRHRLRLAFASRVKDDAAAVSWRYPGEVPGSGTVAHAYYEHLRQLRSGTAEHGKKFDLATVVGFLDANTEPRKFEQSQDALTILREIDLPDRVLRAYRDGVQLDPAEVRQAARVSLSEQVSPGDCQDLLAALGMVGSAGDWPAIGQRLDQVTDLGALCRILSLFGRRVLWTAQPDPKVIRGVLEAARTRGLDDDFLADLVVPPKQATLLGVRCAAGLLADALSPDGSDAGTYPVTRDILARSPAAVAAYLAALAGSGDAAARLLTWLSPLLPAGFAEQLAIALGSKRGRITDQGMAELARREPGCVSALLAIGSATGRLDQLLPGFTLWAASSGELDPPERRYLSARLGDLVTTTPAQQAWLDLGLLSMGAPPATLPPPAHQPDSEPYISNLTSNWKRLERQSPMFSPERCVQAWANYLSRQEWASRKAQAAAVADLAGRLLAYDRQNLLAGEVGSRLAAIPAAKHWDFAQDWLARVRKNNPDAVRDGLLATLETLPPGSGAGQLAELCVRARQERLSPDEVCRKLARSGAVDSARLAVDTVLALQQGLRQSGVEDKTIDEWLDVFAGRLVQGTFGDRVAQEFRALMSFTLRREVGWNMRLLNGLMEAGRERQNEITDEEWEDLTWCKELCETIQKKSRKPFLRWGRGGNSGPPGRESQ